MSLRLSPLLALVLIALPATPARAGDRAHLVATLSAGTAKFGPRSGALVYDATAGAQIYARRADTALMPASNEKLFTTSTALRLFGPSGTLRTTVRRRTDADIDAAGVLHGDLYLVGGGDPSLDDVALRSLVTSLKQDAGLRRITGGVVGDESYLDTRRGSRHTDFAPDSDLGGQLGGLTWGHGRAYPGGPATVAAARLQAFLKAAGVKAGRSARSGSAPVATEGPGPLLASVASPPMSTLIAITNKPSDNFYAETLLKDIGARFGAGGSTAAGLTAMRSQVRKLHISPKLSDGSGLSRLDRATPRQIVSLLQSMSQGSLAKPFQASLATPGTAGTTLATRMRGTAAVGRCRAKTGTLRDVSALSGYCTTTGGHVLIFSFLENAVSPTPVKKIEDRLVPAIAAYSG